ncbi:MAG: phosphate ABC transporter permease PstA [Phycisphaera sp.]|nr:phosphate ABC transporter permease PstA [Phycisphaera sp.]
MSAANRTDLGTLVELGKPRRQERRRILDRGFLVLCLLVTTIAVLALVVLLTSVLIEGLPGLSWDFIDRYTSRKAGDAGIKAPLWGSIWVAVICAVVALPIGVATAVYLEEFAPKNRIIGFVRLNISNLAGVPSIVYGILGLTIFVRMLGLFGPALDPAVEIGGDIYAIYYDVSGEAIRYPMEDRSEVPSLATGDVGYVEEIEEGPDGELIFTNVWSPVTLTIVPDDADAPAAVGAMYEIDVSEPADVEVVKPWYYLQFPFGQSVLAGGMTLMLVVLPIVIISSQEALRAVPGSLRSGSLAMGATPWQTTSRVTLPAAIPMIMTGAILAMSRAIGEAAPILVLGVALFITDVPSNLMDNFTVLPMQIYNWTNRWQEDFRALAASGIIVLLGTLLVFNAVAVLIRQKLQRPLQ